MIQILRVFFGLYNPPMVGEVFDAQFERDPWTPTTQAKVLDVRDGWVKYCFVGLEDYEHKNKIKNFMSIYKKHE